MSNECSLGLLFAKNECRKRPNIAMLSILFEWILIIGTIVLCELSGSSLVIALGCFFIATRIYALTELTHEATHGNLFFTKKAHLFLEFAYSWPVFVDLRSYAPGHLKHHANMNVHDRDPSFYWLKREGLFAGPNRASLIWILVIRPLLGYQALREIRDLKYYFVNSRTFRINITIFWGVVITVCYFAGVLSLLLLYWIFPFFWLGTTFRFWKEVEDHYNADSGIRSVKPRAFYAFLLNPYSCGNHHLHHQYPNIPWYNMKHVMSLVSPPAADVSRNFFETLLQILRYADTKKKWPSSPRSF